MNVTEDSELSRVLGARISVNSYHHQAVLTPPGEGVVVSARALDGVVEGIEMPDADVVAVQWHPPEMFGGDPLFDWLVERAVDRTRGTDLSEHSLHAAG